MAIASITQWLNSPDKNYNHGRLLYEQYGKSRVILALISSGSTNYHYNKLFDALQELNLQEDLQPVQIKVAEYKPDPINIPGSKESIDFKDAPDKILELRDRKNENYAQARHLHESIRWLDRKAHRLEAALQLLNLMDQVNEAWGIIDEWKEKGNVRLIEEKKQMAEVAELSHVELLKEEKRLGPNVTKDRAKLQAATDQLAIIKLSTRLQEREIRLEQVRRRLRELI